jgi:hypothetical protein
MCRRLTTLRIDDPAIAVESQETLATVASIRSNTETLSNRPKSAFGSV